jgi:UDP-N-acetylglucosamine 2-epimerase (non-hydrolysing)
MSLVFDVGHVMVDNVLFQADKLSHMADTRSLESNAYKARHARSSRNTGYGVITLHRPSNVDSAEALERIASVLRAVSAELPLVFPVHPRTRANIAKFGIELGPNVELMGPQAYMSFLHLWKDAAVVLTDSGGLQEETTALGVPCITLRDNTERPITVSEGSNLLAGTDPAVIIPLALDVVRHGGKRGRRPALWDGKSAERIVAILAEKLGV